MSKFTYACPVCHQHLHCDSSQARSVMKCPTCYQRIVAPQAPAQADSKLILTGLKYVDKNPSAASGVAASRAPRVPEQQAGSARIILVVLCILATLGGGGFWFYRSAYAGEGKFEDVLYLDGNSTLITPAFPKGVPVGNSPYTISTWVKPDAGCLAHGGWVGWGADGPGQCNNVRLESDNTVRTYWWENDLTGTLVSGNFFDGRFHSVVVTWNGATEIIYLDGVKVAARTPPPPPNVTPTGFVVGKTTADANFKGWIDELLIADRALTATEVANLVEAGRSGPTRVKGQQAYYRFNQPDRLGLDSSGKENQLVTASGTPVLQLQER